MKTAPDLHTLTGAYAVHALTAEERGRFEEHLADCAACGQEVRELQAAAARLAAPEAVSPPPELKRRVLAEIATVRQLPPRLAPGDPAGPAAPPPPAPHRPARLRPRLALAACLAGAVALGAAAWQFHRDDDRARRTTAEARQEQQDLARLLTAPDARTATTRSGGATAAVVWSAAADRAAFLASGLRPLPAGQAYQLWYDDSGTMRPAGLLPPGGTTRLLAGPLHGAVGVGVTVEPAGGSPHPTGSPVLLLALR
ncbi:anti-sigma factor domain-containing protein [Streptomyces sp. NPDC092296]|uniref:anti-sigma factor n=1 Tax=Streptomyces sp. NPDC092296 TaxID=3366012 RepID=UPI0037F7F99F